MILFLYFVFKQSEGQSGIVKGSDHSIIDVWKMGYNGSGIKIVVIDDGLDHTHWDLRDKFNTTISYDFNNNDTDPAPRIDEKDPEFNALVFSSFLVAKLLQFNANRQYTITITVLKVFLLITRLSIL